MFLPEQTKERYELLLQEIVRISDIEVLKRNELSLDQFLELSVLDKSIFDVIFTTGVEAGLEHAAVIMNGTSTLNEKEEK